MNNPWQTNNDGFDDALAQFENTSAATIEEPKPLPSGKYIARLVDGSLQKTYRGKTFFKIRWELADTAHAGLQLVSKHWLTPNALSRTKAELGRLGFSVDHLRGTIPLPAVTAELGIVQRADEMGYLFNEIKKVRPAPAAVEVVDAGEQPRAAHKQPEPKAMPALQQDVPPPETSSMNESVIDGEFGEALF